MNELYPVIEYMNITKPFKYIWLRYITGIDFENHCAKTFRGTYSKKVTKEPEQKEIALDERDLTKCRYQFYYLCGVSAPYVHENNFHLAFIYKEVTKYLPPDVAAMRFILKTQRRDKWAERQEVDINDGSLTINVAPATKKDKNE